MGTNEFLERLAAAKAALVPETWDSTDRIARRRLQLFCYWLAKTQRTWNDPDLDLDEYAKDLRRMHFSERLIREYVCTAQDRMDDLSYRDK